MTCPRCAHDTLDTVTTSPVPGVWDGQSDSEQVLWWLWNQPGRDMHHLRPRQPSRASVLWTVRGVAPGRSRRRALD